MLKYSKKAVCWDNSIMFIQILNFLVLTDKALFQLMEFDAPEHKDNTGHDSKNKGVGEMPIQRQFDEISAEAQGSGCLY